MTRQTKEKRIRVLSHAQGFWTNTFTETDVLQEALNKTTDPNEENKLKQEFATLSKKQS